jgi:hypothetical protein
MVIIQTQNSQTFEPCSQISPISLLPAPVRRATPTITTGPLQPLDRQQFQLPYLQRLEGQHLL